MPRNPITSTLTPDEALRAIYIDFEKRKSGPPILLGACYAEGRRRVDERRIVVRQDVIDPRFGHLAGQVGWSWPGHLHRYDSDARGLRTTLMDLLGRARNQDRLIVSWSQHELAVIGSAGLEPEVLEEFVANYRDGKATARRWLRQAHPLVSFETSEPAATTHQLSKYFGLIGFDVPAEFGVGRTGDNLRRVGIGLNRGSFDRLTSRQQDAWVEVLGHNLYDCYGLRLVVLAASHELAAPGAAPPEGSRCQAGTGDEVSDGCRVLTGSPSLLL